MDKDVKTGDIREGEKWKMATKNQVAAYYFFSNISATEFKSFD